MPNYYVDATANGDIGNATTPALAKQHLQPVMFFVANRNLDQNIWIKAGYYYDVVSPGAGMAGMVGSHIKIRPYGDLSLGNPVLDGRNWIAPGSNRFAFEGPADGGGFFWSLQIGTAESIGRVWAQSVNNGIMLGQRTDGVGLRRTPDRSPNATLDTLASIKSKLGPLAPWYGAGSALGFKLYMWTPNNQDPADYYQGLSFLQAGAGTMGFDCAFRIRSSQDILIQNIDARASRAETFLVFAQDNDPTPSNSIRIVNCNVTHLVTSGFKVQCITPNSGTPNPNFLISDVLFKNCTVNYTTNENEQEYDDDLYNRLVAASDAFFFTGRLDNVRAEDCTTIDAYHTGAVFGASDANSNKPRRTGFRRHKAYASSWNAYARAYESKPCEDSCFFDQCLADGMNVRSQFVGGPLITSPVFIHARGAIRKAGATDGHIGIESYIGIGNATLGTEQYVYQEPTNIRIYNATFGPSIGTPLQFNSYQLNGNPGGGRPFAQFLANTVDIRNSVFLDTLQSRTGQPFLITKDVQVPIGDQRFENCAIYKSGAEAPSIQYRGTTYTDLVNGGAPGFTGTIITDPLIDEKLRPRLGSPLVGAATTVANPAPDFTGRQRPLKGRTIGAYESFNNYSRIKRA